MEEDGGAFASRAGFSDKRVYICVSVGGKHLKFPFTRCTQCIIRIGVWTGFRFLGKGRRDADCADGRMSSNRRPRKKWKERRNAWTFWSIMASLDRNIRSPGVGNGKKRVVKGDINRGLLSLRTRGRGREKRKSRKRGDKSVIFEDTSSIPCTRCTSLWMDTCVRYVCRNVSRDCLRGRERERSLDMYNWIKVGRLGRRGRYFWLVNFLWTFVREVGRWKLVITRVWLLREGGRWKNRVADRVVSDGSMETLC